MRVIIAGGTGFIGKRVIEYWLKQNHTITVVGRSLARIEQNFGARVKGITWEKLNTEILKQADLVLNLTGASVGAQRWNEKIKKEITNSRVGSTKKLASMLAEITENPPALLSASGIGIYGLQPQLPDRLPPKLDENTSITWDNPPDFFSDLGRKWEKAADPAVLHGVRVVFLRFGVVLAKEGGALPGIMKPYKYFFGGPLGTGNQPFSWVAIDDVVRAIDFLAVTPDISGPVNIVAPDCVMQRGLSEAIARAMNRPDVVRVPEMVVKIMLGDEMARELVLNGQRVFPQRLLEAGFKFLYPDVESAVNHVLTEPGLGARGQRTEEAKGFIDVLISKLKAMANKPKAK